MPAMSNPPAWQISPTADGHFRWAAAVRLDADFPPEAPVPIGESDRLPSMADLLIQAGPVLAESGLAGDCVRLPMFRTGLGRSVAPSESSKQKARIIIGKEEIYGGAEPSLDHIRRNDDFQLFRTDSRKPFAVRESPTKKAKSILHAEFLQEECSNKDQGLPLFLAGSGEMVTVKESSTVNPSTAIQGDEMNKFNHIVDYNSYNDKDTIYPMFLTGSGRSVRIKESSIIKAKAVLEEEDMKESNQVGDFSNKDQFSAMFHSGSRNSVKLKRSSILKAATILEGGHINEHNQLGKYSDENQSFPMFSTGLGKPVSVKKSSVTKAAALLGVEETQKNNQVGEYSDKNQSFPMFHTGSGKSVKLKKSSILKAEKILQGGHIQEHNQIGNNKDEDQGFPMFSTGSGKSVSVKKSSVMKAAAILDAEEKDMDNQVGEHSYKHQNCPISLSLKKKIVTLNESSIVKADILQGEGTSIENEVGELRNGNQGYLSFHTGSGKSATVKRYSIMKAAAVLEGKDTKWDQPQNNIIQEKRKFVNSLFQTASKRKIDLSSAGLSSATTLLGLDIDHDLSALQYPEGVPGICATPLIDSFNHHQCAEINSFSCSSGLCVTKYQNHQICQTNPTLPPIKFQTAGGRSLSVSKDALQRARSLLGDPELGHLENETKVVEQNFPVMDNTAADIRCLNKENMPSTLFPQKEGMRKHISGTLPCNIISNSSTPLIWTMNSENLLLDQENAGCLNMEKASTASDEMSHMQKPSDVDLCVTQTSLRNSRTNKDCMTSSRPLVDISNTFNAEAKHLNEFRNEKRKLAKKNSIPPFKRPRNSRFATPLKRSISLLANGSSRDSKKEGRVIRISAYYPFKLKRKSIQEFFGSPPTHRKLYVHQPEEVKHMNPDNALTYRFCNASDQDEICADYFQAMLLQAGALSQYATQEWVQNHYKWIVWKLSCLERWYPTQASGKYLTVTNVLEELKYRYEREVNFGHRSVVKKILDGDASPASMMVLCVSAIYSSCETKVQLVDTRDATDKEDKELNNNSIMTKSNCAMTIEMTDGWYSVDALLDGLLKRQLLSGKLFVGQKLRIHGASLSGWVGPVSPFEARESVKLQIHINGTFRAHWADKLGLCKYRGPPLAFSCVKSGGGKVSRTLVGITRIYPSLYKERYPDGRSVIRSERMEMKVLQLYLERQYNVAEDVLNQQQDIADNDNDSDEGSRVYKILENAAEPEVLMADMTSEQLASFSNYQAKKRENRQIDVQKKIEIALKDAGLTTRDVTPFMKIRVVGLTSKSSSRKGHYKEGLVTIWNPTENQKVNLVEGNMYVVEGLTPLNSSTDILYLQGHGTSTRWKALTFLQAEEYEPFFTARKSVSLSNLGQVPLSSEFDVAAVILHVGEVFISGGQKKQWIFMTDGCSCKSTIHSCILAISFSSPIIDNDLSGIFSHYFVGTTVGFYNIAKRARDQMNHLWVAEATEYSTYSVYHSIPGSCHLKAAALSAEKWARESYKAIQKLKERVLSIIGDRESQENQIT